MKKAVLIIVCSMMLAVPHAVLAADTYILDKAHSSVGFSIAHMMVARTTGGFNDIDGVLRFAPDDLANSVFDITIKAASVDTKNEQRDGHLRNADFFDAARYPDIIFKTRKIVKKDANDYTVTGDLTMKGVTRQVDLPVTVLGPLQNPMSGRMTIGLEAHFRLNRQDYGISWNKTLDNGGILVGNDVDASVLIEAQRQ